MGDVEDCQNSKNCPGISHHFGTSHTPPSLPPSFPAFRPLFLLLDGDGENEKQNRRARRVLCWESKCRGLVRTQESVVPTRQRRGSYPTSTPRKFVLSSWISSTLLCVCVTREDGRTDGRTAVPLLLHFHPPSSPPSLPSVLLRLRLSPSMA